MATYTDNYNLEKPAQSDLYNVDVFNENADKIDEALGDKAENQSLAPIESSATASRNYSVGQQFVYNGLLYEATSAIASGGTITPGSNCARTTVAEELSALNDSLNNNTERLASSSHTVDGYVTKCARIINVHGTFVASNQTSETVTFSNALTVNKEPSFGIVLRDQNNGTFVTAYSTGKKIETYNHIGTITVKHRYSFNYLYFV